MKKHVYPIFVYLAFLEVDNWTNKETICKGGGIKLQMTLLITKRLFYY